MKFITNYPLNDGFQNTYDVNTNGPRTIELHPNDRDPSKQVRYCNRNDDGTYTEIGSNQFLEDLRGERTDEILLYIHGFNNQPESSVFPRAEQLQKFYDQAFQNKRKSVEVVVLLWPCDNDFGVLFDYWDDQEASEMSGYAFFRVLQRFMAHRENNAGDNACYRPINILAHSMGTRLLRLALENYNNKISRVPALFKNIFMVASDVKNKTLQRDQSGYAITQVARNIAVYYANDDLAMTASKVANVRNKSLSRRLGHTGPRNLEKVSENVYAIDCDNINNTYDNPKGHSYFLDDGVTGNAGKVFDHIAETILTGRVGGSDAHKARKQIIHKN
jgi:esterase/lipase superfamily enzyme